jgi:hypothetical protein
MKKIGLAVLLGLALFFIVYGLGWAVGPTMTGPHRITCDSLPVGDNVTGVNIYYSPSIVSITKANPGVVVTSLPHTLATGNQIIFSGIGGMTQLNGVQTTVTIISTTSYSIGINTTAYGTYTSGGGAFDNTHRVINGRIDTLPYDLLLMGLTNGVYQIGAGAFNASSESGLSNIIPFTLAIPGAPQNLSLQP